MHMFLILGATRRILGDATLPEDEEAILRDFGDPGEGLVETLRSQVIAGRDPLGDGYCVAVSPADRRKHGQTFTPPNIVNPMVERAARDARANGDFDRIVDPGCGSARFLAACGKRFPNARLIGFETDPYCAILARMHLAILGLSERAEIIRQDYTTAELPPTDGRTLFIGNPPYVRHHDLSEESKERYANAAAALGAGRTSKLAGLHLHFFVRTAALARRGDFGLFVTAAEWMDASYGSALRKLLAGALGGRSVHVLDAASEPFPGTQATAAITEFMPHLPLGSVTVVPVACADALGDMDVPKDAARFVPSDRRWNPQAAASIGDEKRERIGNRFQVSRGQVTGMNSVWIVPPDFDALPHRFLLPCLTAAREVFAFAEAGGRIENVDGLKRLVSLPEDLSEIEGEERDLVEAFLDRAREMKADLSFVARQRKAWWSIPRQRPAPIVCTYMARRKPVFVRNVAGAALINVIHALRPRQPMTEAELDAACAAMNACADIAGGRIYAGGLAKFEPGDVEALPITWDQTAQIPREAG